MKLHPAAAAVPVVLLLAAVWFGLKLGPRDGSVPQNSRQGAATASRRFINETLRAQKDATTAPVLSPLITTGNSKSNGNVWITSGSGIIGMKGRMGPQHFEWRTVQEWQPDANEWRLRQIDVTRDKSDEGQGR